jgi:hypothetical protein
MRITVRDWFSWYLNENKYFRRVDESLMALIYGEHGEDMCEIETYLSNLDMVEDVQAMLYLDLVGDKLGVTDISLDEVHD